MSAAAVPQERLGRAIKGPSAFGDDPRRFWQLTWALALTDFKLRFFGSALGYLWQLMRPLMLFGVLYVVFSLFLNFGTETRFYPVALLLGIVLFTFFGEATGGAVRSLVNRENLVRKIEFPRLAVPLATVLTALFNLGLNLVPVFVFLLAAGGRPRWTWLLLPLLIVFLTVLALGVAMLLSSLFVRYRDVEPIWDVVLQAMFYATPILYTVQMVADRTSDTVATLLLLNPFAVVLQQARHWLVDPSHQSAPDAIGEPLLLGVPCLVVLGAFVLGLTVFKARARTIAEEL